MSEDLAAELAALQEQVNMEAGLRASADRDLASASSTLRAQHHTIQALAITSSEHNMMLNDQVRILREHGAVLDAHTVSLASAHRKLDQIIGMLSTIIDGTNE